MNQLTWKEVPSVAHWVGAINTRRWNEAICSYKDRYDYSSGPIFGANEATLGHSIEYDSYLLLLTGVMYGVQSLIVDVAPNCLILLGEEFGKSRS